MNSSDHRDFPLFSANEQETRGSVTYHYGAATQLDLGGRHLLVFIMDKSIRLPRLMAASLGLPKPEFGHGYLVVVGWVVGEPHRRPESDKLWAVVSHVEPAEQPDLRRRLRHFYPDRPAVFWEEHRNR